MSVDHVARPLALVDIAVRVVHLALTGFEQSVKPARVARAVGIGYRVAVAVDVGDKSDRIDDLSAHRRAVGIDHAEEFDLRAVGGIERYISQTDEPQRADDDEHRHGGADERGQEHRAE